MPEQTAVAMSGGVDSSAAAWLLRQEGRPLVGFTLQLFPPRTGEDPARDAGQVARAMGFPHHTVEMAQTFREQVIDPFVADYEAGRTPNPCVLCNRRIKFGVLLQQALDCGCDKLATGHYARLSLDRGSGRWLLRKALHPEKDQSYVLSTLGQDQLAHALFPLGGLTKDQVRDIARQAGLSVAHKGESQDICFVPDGDYGAFLRRYTGRDYPAGPFLDPEGRVLGQHTGIVDYTVGQRRGLGVSSSCGRLYVREIRPADRAVVLSDNSSLFGRTLAADGLNLIACRQLDRPTRLWAKIRYRMTEQPCTVEQTGPDTIRLVFDQPQRAITPGQTVALYDGDTVVGGATLLRGASEP